MVRYVYVDVLFLTNLAVNYLLLVASGKLSGCTVKHGRLLLSALAGALYAVTPLYVQLEVAYSLPARFLFGLLMVLAAYPGVKGTRFLGLLASFYLCSAVAAGTALALVETTPVGAGFGRAPGAVTEALQVRWWKVVLALGSISIYPVLSRMGHLRLGKGSPSVQVQLTVCGRTVSVPGIVDTGNTLRDPATGWPVVVVDWDCLREVLPRELSPFFLSIWDKIPHDLSRSDLSTRLGLIPFRNVSGHKGILPAFRPDSVLIKDARGNRVPKNAVIGVSRERLSPAGVYHALVHPDLLDP